MRYYYDQLQFEDMVGCVLSGLVVMTPACFTIQVWHSMIFGILASVMYFVNNHITQRYLKLDDPLRVGTTHFGSGFSFLPFFDFVCFSLLLCL